MTGLKEPNSSAPPPFFLKLLFWLADVSGEGEAVSSARSPPEQNQFGYPCLQCRQADGAQHGELLEITLVTITPN